MTPLLPQTIEIIEGDCRDFPATEAPKFQMLASDLPYSEHVHANITSAGTMGEGSRGWHRQELAFPPLTPELLAHVALFSARIQGWVLLYSDVESAHILRAACTEAKAEYVRAVLRREELDHGDVDPDEDVYSGVLPWERWSQAQKTGDRPTQTVELVNLFWGRAHSRKAWNGPGTLTSFKHKSMRGDGKHRTQKPLDQALDIAAFFCNVPGMPWGEHHAVRGPLEGGKGSAVETVPAAVVAGRTMTATPAQRADAPVLDLTCGSATMGVACALLGLSFVGWELDPKAEGWVKLGEERCQAALHGELPFFDDRARVERWCTARLEEGEATPFPKAKDGSDVKTWERAQRRLWAANRVAELLK